LQKTTAEILLCKSSQIALRNGIFMELWFTEMHSDNVRFSIRVNRQLHSEQSEFQRIDVFESDEFGRFPHS
jgi:hypothetical protein